MDEHSLRISDDEASANLVFPCSSKGYCSHDRYISSLPSDINEDMSNGASMAMMAVCGRFILMANWAKLT